MPKEIPNQIQSGILMSEMICFGHLINALGIASDAARGLAHSRKDVRWLAVSKIIVEISDNAKKLRDKPQGLTIQGFRSH